GSARSCEAPRSLARARSLRAAAGSGTTLQHPHRRTRTGGSGGAARGVRERVRAQATWGKVELLAEDAERRPATVAQGARLPAAEKRSAELAVDRVTKAYEIGRASCRERGEARVCARERREERAMSTA